MSKIWKGDFLYVLRLSNKTLYIGVTSYIHRRIIQHLVGTGSKHTSCCEIIEVVEIFKVPYKIKTIVECYYTRYIASKIGDEKVTCGPLLKEVTLQNREAKIIIKNKKDEPILKNELNNMIRGFYSSNLDKHVQDFFKKYCPEFLREQIK